MLVAEVEFCHFLLNKIQIINDKNYRFDIHIMIILLTRSDTEKEKVCLKIYSIIIHIKLRKKQFV